MSEEITLDKSIGLYATRTPNGILKVYTKMVSTNAGHINRSEGVFTKYDLARLLIFAAGSLKEALNTLTFEVDEMERRKQVDEMEAEKPAPNKD